ncbi:hypothetical protein DSO57_1020861 [Entomophthora muscae]|uniref:Uncharacterized protein n=1 Tax=Entomophthora muscae TaxID=34485 RepID=A0ACC2RIB3_9FUNG|nr:hypothetical protein DSO57_1020861 [Entomophthora muscae]
MEDALMDCLSIDAVFSAHGGWGCLVPVSQLCLLLCNWTSMLQNSQLAWAQMLVILAHVFQRLNDDWYLFPAHKLPVVNIQRPAKHPDVPTARSLPLQHPPPSCAEAPLLPETVPNMTLILLTECPVFLFIIVCLFGSCWQLCRSGPQEIDLDSIILPFLEEAYVKWWYYQLRLENSCMTCCLGEISVGTRVSNWLNNANVEVFSAAQVFARVGCPLSPLTS